MVGGLSNQKAIACDERAYSQRGLVVGTDSGSALGISMAAEVVGEDRAYMEPGVRHPVVHVAEGAKRKQRLWRMRRELLQGLVQGDAGCWLLLKRGMERGVEGRESERDDQEELTWAWSITEKT